MPGWRLCAILALVTVLGVVSCAGPPPPVPITPAPKGMAAPEVRLAGDATRGKQLYARTCLACHGADGKGMPGLGKDVTNSAFVRNQSEQQLVEFLKRGRAVTDPANTTKTDMPPRGGDPTVTDQQLVDIVVYLRTLS